MCRALGIACCTNEKLDQASDMCPGATADQSLVCSALEDYETEVVPATCVECGKSGQDCCIADSTFADRVCEGDLACTESGCAPCGCVSCILFLSLLLMRLCWRRCYLVRV